MNNTENDTQPDANVTSEGYYLVGVIEEHASPKVSNLFSPSALPYAFPTKLLSTLHFPQLTKNG